MPGKIPQSFIDELIARVDIVDVIDARVPLKKAGRDYTACCPFHHEKTASFTVSQNKQFYHCFGCGAHGTAIGFIMEYERLSFPDAIEELAASVGLPVPVEAQAQNAPSYEGLYDILQQAQNFYKRQLRTHSTAQAAIQYLKQRGMSGEIAVEFGVGYAPPGWDELSQQLGTTSAQEKWLIQAGLVKESNGKTYDRFRNRIMIPILDRRGRVIAFGGRLLSGDGPKYLNSPETPVFHKSKALFGLYEAKKKLRHPEKLVVVEGYMDVIALAQHDLPMAVATLGTATTKDHLHLLFKTTAEIIFCFDGDRAGRQAAWRALENALELMQDGRQARFLFLPEGEDPDSFVHKQGKAALQAAFDKSPTFSEFFFESLSNKLDLKTVEGRARLAELARPYLQKLPEGVFKQLMFERLTDLVKLRENRVLAPAQSPRQPQSHKRITNKKQSVKAIRTPLRLAIALLLQHPQLAQSVSQIEALKQVSIAGIHVLVGLLEMLQASPHLTTAALLERWRNTPDGEHLFKLAQLADLELPKRDQHLAQEFNDTIQRILFQQSEKRWEYLQHKLHAEGLSSEEINEWNQLLKSK